MDRRICVITGATSGVGYQAAKRLAEGGADLVLVCRNIEKGVKVQTEFQREYGTKSDVVPADLSRLADVRVAADIILDSYPHLNVLINNAGVHRTSRTLTEEGFETAFCVNHLASFLLTRLLLDRLIESSPARIIQVNSQGHRFGGLELNDLSWERRRYRGLQGYGASKIAQLLTVWELSDILEETGVTINAMHPGAVRSNIGMDNGRLYRLYLRYLLWPLLKGPEISGNAIYYLAAAPEMKGVSGRFYNQTIDEKPAPLALDRSLGRQVWKISEELTGLPELHPVNGRGRTNSAICRGTMDRNKDQELQQET